MIYISIALVIIFIIIGYVSLKFIDWLKLESDRKHQLNIKSSEEEVSAAIENALKKFDSRINDTWGTISSVKEEVNALRLQIGLRKPK